MRNAEIDAAIITQVGLHWRKVAAIVALVANGFGRDEVWARRQVAKRIRVLARKGLLEVVGNPYIWRGSEIRLRQPSARI